MRICPYIISQVSSLIVVVVIIGVYVLSRVTADHDVSAFDTLPPIQFNSDEKPTLFAQITDLHISEFYSQSQENLISMLDVINASSPELIFATGDLQDSYTDADFPKYSAYHPQNWVIYENIVKDYDRNYYFEIPGNHDDFGTATFNGTANSYFRDHVYKDEDEYYVKTVNYKDFVILELYTIGFPHSHDVTDFWAEPTTRILDLIEKALADIPEDKELIIVNHFPLNWHLEHAKSTSGHTYNELIEPCKARIYLSGHVHPETTMMYHHPKFMEMCTSDVRYHQKAAYITFDNKRVVFHEFASYNPPAFLITNPIPYSQLSPSQPGLGAGEPIRVLAFGDQEPDLNVEGDVEGHMSCKRMEPHWVCELPLPELSSGMHNISIEGKDLEFTTANHVESFTESRISLEDPMPILVALIVVMVYLALILVPYPEFFKDNLEDFDRWVEDEAESESNMNWFFCTFFSGFVLKHRINRLPKYIRYILLAAAAWPIILPTLFMEVESNFGFIWSYGYFVLGEFMSSQWGFIHTLIYEGLVVCPVVYFASMASYEKWSNGFIWDIIVSIIFLFAHSYLMVKYTIRIISVPYACYSPSTVILPVFLYALLIAYRFIMHGKSENNNDNQHLLDERSLASQSSTFSYVQ